MKRTAFSASLLAIIGAPVAPNAILAGSLQLEAKSMGLPRKSGTVPSAQRP